MGHLLEIIQQYFNTTLAIDNNTSATILITLLVFLFGHLFNQLINTITNIRERFRIKILILLNIKHFALKVKEQSDEFKIITDQLKISYTGGFNFNKIDIAQINNIKEIGYMTSYNVLFRGVENIKLNTHGRLGAFNRFWEIVYSVEYWQLKVTDIELLNNLYKEYNGARNEILQQIRKKIISLLSIDFSKVNDPVVQNYREELSLILLEWNSLNECQRPDIIHRYLIIRIRLLNRKYQGLSINFIKEFDELIDQETLQYMNLSNTLRQYELLYSDMTKLFFDYSNDLKPIYWTLKPFFLNNN